MFPKHFAATALVLLASNAALAQTAPLDKLQGTDIPAAERDGLPAEVVSILGSHQGWHKGFGLSGGLHVTAENKLISTAGSGVHLWNIADLRLLGFGMGTGFEVRVVAASSDGKRLAVLERWFPEERLRSVWEPWPCILQLWKVQDGKITPVQVLIDKSAKLYDSTVSAAFVDNDNTLVVVADYGPVIPNLISPIPGHRPAPVVRTWNLGVRPIKEEAEVRIDALSLGENPMVISAGLANRGRWVGVVASVGQIPKAKTQLIFVDITTQKVVKSHDLSGLPWQLSEDARWLAVVESESALKVYDISISPPKLHLTGARVPTWRPVIAFDRPSKQFAYFGTDAKDAPLDPLNDTDGFSLRLVDLTAKPPKEQVIQADLKRSEIDALTFAPDGAALFAVRIAKGKSRVEAWDLQAKPPKRKYANDGHQDAVSAVAFTPDAQFLLTAGEDRQLCLWDLADRKPRLADVAKSRGRVQSISRVPGSTLWAVTGIETNGIALWSVKGKKFELVHESAEQKVPLWQTASLAGGKLLFSAVGNPLMHSSLDDSKPMPKGSVAMWQVTGDKLALAKVLGEHKGSVLSVTLSPDGKLLVTAGGWRAFNEKHEPVEFGEILVWDLTGAGPKRIASLDGPPTVENKVLFSDNGKVIASASTEPIIRLWQVEGKKVTAIKALIKHDVGVHALAFSPDGKKLLSADSAGCLVMWDVDTGKDVRTWQFHDSIFSLAFAPDGRHFVTGNASGTAYIFRLPQAAN